MDEFELIRRFFARGDTDRSVLLGIGDDGAVISPSADRSLVVVVDTLVAGVHYPAAFPAQDTGYRAVVVNVSDLAAMGAKPRWMTLALTLTEADEAWLTGFSAGLFEAAREYGLTLIGGDTTRGAQTVISAQLIGEIDADAVLTRAGARAGERVYVTGTPGDAAAGLELIDSPRAGHAAEDAEYLMQRFSRPRARAAFGASLAGVATAAIDVSDGLGSDLAKLLAASGIGARIDLDRLPVSTQLTRVFGAERGRQLALDGGDDYELCFTAKDADAVSRCADGHGVLTTCIGETTGQAGLVCVQNGREFPYRDGGYRHF